MLGQEIGFWLVTSDRDLGDQDPYPNVVANSWTASGDAHVYYAAPGLSWVVRLWRIIAGFKGDVVYLNGFFSFRFSILPVILWRILVPHGKIILAPKGEFSEAALGLKSLKKRLFISAAKLLGLYRRTVWVATSLHEAEDIRRTMGRAITVRIAPNIACPPQDFAPSPRLSGGPLRVVFLSRIAHMKNLKGAIEIMQQVKCPVVFHVYGPAEDARYWADCQNSAIRLPANIAFQYMGAAYPTQVPEILQRYDLFFLPTLGENYGHVVAEALGCGTPVLISNATPWRGLAENGLGWDVPLDRPDRFVRAIEECFETSSDSYKEWRHRIRSWALENIRSADAVEQNRRLFSGLE